MKRHNMFLRQEKSLTTYLLSFSVAVILMFSTMTDAMSLEEIYQMDGGYYGEIYKKDRSVLVSTSNQKEVPLEIEVVAVEPDTDKEVITKASLCFEDGTGCMELETK